MQQRGKSKGGKRDGSIRKSQIDSRRYKSYLSFISMGKVRPLDDKMDELVALVRPRGGITLYVLHRDMATPDPVSHCQQL